MKTQIKKTMEKENKNNETSASAETEYVIRNGEKYAVREDGVAGYVDNAGGVVARVAFGILALGLVAAGVAAFF